jgi:hypothetical protein
MAKRMFTINKMIFLCLERKEEDVSPHSGGTAAAMATYGTVSSASMMNIFFALVSLSRL